MTAEADGRPIGRRESRFVAARAVPFAIAALAVVARLVILRATHSTTEDFLITLRYANNLAHGWGFVYNPGEHVLGTTTPLYTLYLALATWAGLNPILWGKLANIVADGITSYLIARLLAALGRPRVGWLAALLYATASAPVNFSIGGMETALVTLAGFCAIYAFVTRRSLAMWVSLAVLLLLRVDGLLLAVILAGAQVWRDRRLPWRDLLIALAIVAPWLIFASVYFGSPVPTSLVAKLAVYGRLFPQAFPNREALYHQFLGGATQKLLFAAFLGGAWVAARSYRALIPGLIWLTLYYAAMLVSKVIAFGWYFMPPLPVYYVIVALGIGWVVGSLGRWAIGWSMLRFGTGPAVSAVAWDRVVTVCLLGLAAGLTVHLRSIRADIAAAQRREDVVRLPIGLWLADHYPPTFRVMLEPIGYVGYYSRLRVLDLVGLVSPEVLPCYAREIQHPLGEMVARFRPDLLLLRQSEAGDIAAYDQEKGAGLLDREYRAIRAFPGGRQRVAFTLYERVHSDTISPR